MVKYEFPSPDDKAEWQRLVNESIAAQKLTWRRVDSRKWVIDGECPRCAHSTNQDVDLEVLVADSVTSTSFEASAERMIAVELVCSCREEPPHNPDARGCGFGKGLVIAVANPEGDDAGH